MASFSWLPAGLLLVRSRAMASPENNIRQLSKLPNKKLPQLVQPFIALLQQSFPQLSQGRVTLWEMVKITALLSVLPCFWYLQRQRGDNKPWSWTSADDSDQEDAADEREDDPGLLKKHSEYRSFTTTRFTYPSLRLCFRRHPQADKLPTRPAPLPLLVFIHGLGGSTHQFHSLLTTMVNMSSCLAIDLPGCGKSTFAPTAWDAYTTEALVELLAVIIEEYREKDAGQGVVLVGHSMGCSLAAMLASKTAPKSYAVSEHVVGLVAICPKAEPPSEQQVATFRKLLWIPNPVFDAWRKWDRRGGINSQSVRRFVGDADVETRKLQERFNEESKTPVWRRMASGTLPVYQGSSPIGGLPGRDVWIGLDCPVFLIAGEADNITKPAELDKIASFLGKTDPTPVEIEEDSRTIVDTAAPVNISIEPVFPQPSEQQIRSLTKEDFEGDSKTIDDVHEDPSTPNEPLSIIPPQPWKPKKVLKTTILPAPASHALLYMPSTVRTLAGLISNFLCSQVSPRLSLGWQLQFLSTAGKWDVKNLAKWQAVNPVSEPIAGIFCAMKTLREVDETHCPKVFVQNWGPRIKDIVDISHESPVYDPRGLESGGTHYHKFPTVSKIPPTAEEVRVFIGLIDRLIEEQKERAAKEGWKDPWYVGVHCHYGFNRTGYFIVCYLVERCGYEVQAAINEFAKRRPKGIKHQHFRDSLFVRYCKGLKRAPTL